MEMINGSVWQGFSRPGVLEGMYVCAPPDKGDLVGLSEEPAHQLSREIPGL